MQTTVPPTSAVLDHKVLETRGFRPEIQGLRALALFLVVSYHIWFGRVSGGVDVFLFISAFLLSLSSLRKINEGRPLAPVKYWLHVFQRLLPAAVTVTAATVAASFIFLAPSRLASIVEDALATLFYFLNWRLAYNAVDYYAQDAAVKTPLQHFWSLSMQGQIFILWPLLFVLLALLVRRLKLPLVPTALLVFGLIFVASLIFSIQETAHNQGFAYFDTRARLWEFAAGTLLALLTFKWRPPRWARIPMGWLGIVGLVSCGFVLPVEQAFPGYLALWPLVSGALIILAGQTGSALGVDRFLASGPMLKLGEVSYALYLVHWPIFIIYSTRTQQDHPGLVAGTGLISISLVLASIIHVGVEQPLRQAKTRPVRSAGRRRQQKLAFLNRKSLDYLRPMSIIVSCLLLLALPLTASKAWLQERDSQLAALASSAGSADFPGAYALGQRERHYSYPPVPASDLMSQFSGLDKGNCTGDLALRHDQLAAMCGAERNGASGAPLLMVIGDSHAGQSVAIYRQLAERSGANIMDLHLGGCTFPLEAEPGPSQECLTYNALIVDEILAQRPASVALMITQTDPVTNEEAVLTGLGEQIERITQAGIKVIGLRDNPRWKQNIYDCAQSSPENLQSCSQPLSQKLSPRNPATEMLTNNPGLYGLDFTQQLCPDDLCVPVIGNIYVYMDDNHLSKAYATTLIEEAQRQLKEQGWSLLEGPEPST